MTGDTFRAVSRHAAADPLIAPGEVDLSAHVDFRAHRRARRALRVRWPMARSGRANSSAGWGSPSACAGCLQNASPAQRTALESGCARLVSLDAMGELFKVLALTAGGWPGAARLHGARATAMKLESACSRRSARSAARLLRPAGRRKRRGLGFPQCRPAQRRPAGADRRQPGTRRRGAGRDAGPARHGAPGARCHGAGRGRALGQRGRLPKPTRW